MSEKIVPDSIARWLKSLDVAGDKLLFRRAHVDLCDGDHLAAIIFGQLLYYHLPDSKGATTRLRVQKEGFYWVAKKHREWWEECRINAHTAKKKVSMLKSLGLVITDNFRFNGIKTVHLRIDFACLAARIGALESSAAVGSIRSDPVRPDGSDRSDQIDPTGQSAPVQPLTETTAENITERKNPKPFEKGFSDFTGVDDDLEEADPGPSGVYPAATAPEFPKNPAGRADWVAAVRQYDLATAEAVSRLFPDSNTPLVSHDVARKFVKRRGGMLGGKSAAILARWLPHARYEGMVAPDWKKACTFAELLDTRVLGPALFACRQAAVERLEDIEAAEEQGDSLDYAAIQMNYLGRMITGDTDLVGQVAGVLPLDIFEAIRMGCAARRRNPCAS